MRIAVVMLDGVVDMKDHFDLEVRAAMDVRPRTFLVVKWFLRLAMERMPLSGCAGLASVPPYRAFWAGSPLPIFDFVQ